MFSLLKLLVILLVVVRQCQEAMGEVKMQIPQCPFINNEPDKRTVTVADVCLYHHTLNC